VFRGHFPGRPIWPGSYTIEGLAQACALVGGLAGGLTARDSAATPAAAVDSLSDGAAMVAAVKVKLLRPVVPPATLIYRVEHTHAVGDVHRFAVEASVDGVAVAQGTLDVVWRAGR
jgi:3-hydroxymyristoyl/3-hydroxydecanoyl-(acyl carrier protein) dehydratase